MLVEPDERSDEESKLIGLSSRVLLPVPEEEFLAKSGVMPGVLGDLRRFQRRYFRFKAPFRVLKPLPAFQRDASASIVYTRDVSIGGIGFMTHEQLYPCEQAIVSLPRLGEMIISITSCRYVSPSCYEAGAMFLGTHLPN